MSTAPSIDLASFSARLRAVRKAFGHSTGNPSLSRATFAREIGVEHETYRRWERGHIRPPLEVLASIRRLTGISLDYLIADTEPGNAQPNDLTAQCTATDHERLRWAREIHVINPAEAAEKLRVSAETYGRWEDGREIMPESKLAEFATHFRVSVAYLVDGRSEGIWPAEFKRLRRLHPDAWQPVEPPDDTSSTFDPRNGTTAIKPSRRQRSSKKASPRNELETASGAASDRSNPDAECPGSDSTVR